jgi:hypothetical protein
VLQYVVREEQSRLGSLAPLCGLVRGRCCLPLTTAPPVCLGPQSDTTARAG